jgi:hypothetical protein
LGATNYSFSFVAGTLTITQASSSVSVVASANPSTYTGAVTFTATVPAGATGTVTFKDGSTVLGAGTISGTTATYATAALLGGGHSITGVYSGDGNFTGSTSGALSQTVNTAAVTVSISSSKNPSSFDDSIIITITTSGAGVVPTGTVTLADGVTPLATPTLDGTGKTTYTTAAFPAGAHNLVATYSGDSNYH